MRRSLSDSLAYIHEAAGDRLSLGSARAQGAVASIAAHRVPPGVFGRYYKLVLALQSGADDLADNLFTEIAEMAGQVAEFRVDLYTDASLGRERQLFGDLIDPNPGATPWLCPPAAADGFEQRVRDSMDMIRAADPALGRELSGLAIQVVGAVPFNGPDARPFGSVSSFMLWGLLVVNMQRYRTAPDLVQGLVHEAAHLLLFAHSIDEPLVTNSIDERYISPLRPDPRPMDGVFHATFVSARMHYVNRALRAASSDTFQPVPVAELDERLSDLRRVYFGGVQTVREHAKLTGTGRRVLEETLDYMQAV